MVDRSPKSLPLGALTADSGAADAARTLEEVPRTRVYRMPANPPPSLKPETVLARPPREFLVHKVVAVYHRQMVSSLQAGEELLQSSLSAPACL